MSGVYDQLTMLPVSSQSGWVQAAGWYDGELYVQFRDARCIYADPTGSLYRGISLTNSAGTFVHRYLYKMPYRIG